MERMITRRNVGSQEKQYLLTSTLTVAAQADTQKIVSPVKIERSYMKPQLGETWRLDIQSCIGFAWQGFGNGSGLQWWHLWKDARSFPYV